MKYTKLGNSDLSVSRICLGCMGFGEAGNGQHSWWYTLPMPVLSFVEEYDFSGKTIVPLCTHRTGGRSSTIRDLTAALPDDVSILDAIGVYRPDVDSSRSAGR